jgi:hypothetical protein
LAQAVLLHRNKEGNKMKKAILVVMLLLIFVTGCREANVASNNLSVSADNFEIIRRIVFYNGITSEYILVVEGLCSLGNYDLEGELSVTCKVGSGQYVKHYLGLSDNVTYFAEQLVTANVDTYHYRVIFRPETVLPSIELDTSN